MEYIFYINFDCRYDVAIRLLLTALLTTIYTLSMEKTHQNMICHVFHKTQ